METDLDSLKYSELQRLAKSVGLKANLKADKLLKVLKDHFQQEPKGESSEQDTDNSDDSASPADSDALNSSQEQEAPSTNTHVTKRRGRPSKAKVCTKPKENANDLVKKGANPPEGEQVPDAVLRSCSPSRAKVSTEVEENANDPVLEDANPSVIEHVPDSVLHGRSRSRAEGSTKLEENASDLVPEDTSPPVGEQVANVDGTKEKRVSRGPNSGRRQQKRQLSEDSPIAGVTKSLPADHEVTQAELEFQTAEKDATTKSKTHAAAPPGGKISCHAGPLSKSGTRSKPATPNFKKIHEAHFKTMESIETYVERKRRRVEDFSSSVKEVKMLAEKVNLLKPTEKKAPVSNKKLMNKRASLFSPLPSVSRRNTICTPSLLQRARDMTVCTPSNLRRSPRTSICSVNKSILSDKSTFKPSVLSTAKMNVRFSEATKDNEHKRSLTKTPARMSPYIAPFNTPSISENELEPGVPQNSEPMGAGNRNSAITPFKFSAQNAETPGTNKKSVFDLKASLSRPLGYQPHKGKLKPWMNGKENNPAPKMAPKSNAAPLKNYKQPPLQTREERRDKHKEERKEKKQNIIRVRRGLVMS